MTEFRHQVPGASEEIESVDIYLPDDSEPGTGEFTLIIKPDALPTSKVLWSTIIHPPELQVSATFDTGMNVAVKLGLIKTLDLKNFRIPEAISQHHKHTFRVNFSKWKLSDAFLDDQPLGPA